MRRIFTYLLLALFSGGMSTSAQTINTTVGSTGYTGNNNSGVNTFITFVIENTTGGAIILTDVGNWTTTSHNGTTSTLYYSSTNLSGNLPGNVVPAAGWTFIASNVVAGVTTTGVNPVITGMNFIIPAGAIYRFALHTTGTNYYSGSGVGTASPNTFTNSGIIMRTGDYQIAGQYVGYGYSNNPRFFTGFATFMPATPCSGMPTAGTASLVNGCPSSVQVNGATLETDLTLQWQRRLTCGATGWTDIPGATGYRYSIVSQPNPTEYRLYIVCDNSGLSDTSNTVTVVNVPPCYCPSGATSASYADITNVMVGNFINSSACVGTGATYTNFMSSVPPVSLLKGDSYALSVSVGNCGTLNTAQGIAVFIDYDQDGSFSTAERVYGSTGTNNSASFTVNGFFTVPLNAMPGITGMRVISAYNTAGVNITGCQTFTYGETEDYMVDIRFAPEVTGSGLSPLTYSGIYCSGDSVVLTASAPGVTNPSYVWKKPGNVWDTSRTLVLNPIQTSQGGNYYVYLLTENCPGNPPDTSAPRLVQLTVNPTPGKPIVTPVITYCEGDVFDSLDIFGENITWYTVPTGGIAGPAPDVNTSVPGTQTYYISQTVNGCEGPRAQLTLNVAPKPQPPTVTSPVGYCQGEPSAPLIAQGQNLRWYSVPQGGVGTPVAPVPNTQGQGTYTWYVTQTVAGCESERQPVVVNIGYVPNGLITVSRAYVCQYDTLTIGYFGNALPDADYTWTLPGGAQIVDGTGQGPLTVRFDSSGSQRIKVIIANGGCVGPETYVDIPVETSPKLTIDLPEDVCADDIASLIISWSTIGIDSFVWDFAGAEIAYGSFPKGPYGLRWNSGGEKTVSVIASAKSCKSQPATDKIQVHALPDVSITATNTNICAGDSVLFSVPYEAGASYQWLPHQYFGESNSHEVWAIVDKAATITVNAVTSWNCKSRGEMWVGVHSCCQIYFPTAFSPNNDGKNDVFRMLTVGKDKRSQTTAHQIATFRVANRWGQTVFETADETQSWDGSFNGEPQPMGTYYYFVKYKCADGNFYEEQGEVTLVR